MKRKTAKIWNYVGNHSSGSDHVHKDPHNFGIEVIKRVQHIANAADGEEYSDFVDWSAFTREEIMGLEVQNHQGDDFGYASTVKAPTTVWEKVGKGLGFNA